jgi:predicted RNA binding protein YcfA (HicA-like mRNA interferase family)
VSGSCVLREAPDSPSGSRPRKILEDRGRTLERINVSHPIRKRPEPPSSIPLPVHGNRDLSTGTQRRILRQAGLTDADL